MTKEQLQKKIFDAISDADDEYEDDGGFILYAAEKVTEVAINYANLKSLNDQKELLEEIIEQGGLIEIQESLYDKRDEIQSQIDATNSNKTVTTHGTRKRILPRRNQP